MNAITFRQAWDYGGPLMWVLAGLSVIAFAVCLYLLFAQRRGALSYMIEDIRRSRDPAAAGGRMADRMYSSVEWLADIAAIAPLIGLLGTVLGMFSAFGGIASDVAANAKPVVLAQGVSQAIVTTIFGLAIAIPSLAAYAYFRRRTARRVAQLEEMADEVCR